ncbi:MAG: GDP-mannose 4,6-dehydratase [Deltaproteobacteria bacterium]|nr:GDP-mannose 4,6-dehydratase [Deltaproteobacteria bacterium]
MKRAFITGITGQDGSYLSELLLSKGYEVHGMIRRSSSFNTGRIDHLYQDPRVPGTRLFLHYGDLSDPITMRRLLDTAQPNEVYNLGAQSHVRVSFDQPEYTADIGALGTLRLLEAVRDHVRETKQDVRVYQAGSSEMFGGAPPPQNEATPFMPRSPYAIGKLAAHWFAVNYREAYGLFVSNGILFNHESPRRGKTFVTRKITSAATRIKLGLSDALYLGNLEARRDWGFAGDYVEAMWLMLQAKEPDDFVVATGETHSVREFVGLVFDRLSLDWKKYVRTDPRYFRPTEVDVLLGDPSKAKRVLGWAPRVGLERLVEMMVEHDLEHARRERTLKDAGYQVDSDASHL